MRHDRLQLRTRTMHGLTVHHRDVLGFDAIRKGLCEQHEEAKAEAWFSLAEPREGRGPVDDDGKA
jgi:hypothetical protein